MICINSVTVSPKNLELTKGNEGNYVSANVSPWNATCTELEWSSSNPSVVGVNASTGYMIANGAGTATITAAATDGSGAYDTCTVTVTAPTTNVPVESVSVYPSSVTLNVGDCYPLMVTVCPSNATNKAVNLSSMDDCVATVENGSIKAISAGSTVIKAEAADDRKVTGVCYVTVCPKAAEETPDTWVEIDKECICLDVGQEYTLHATVHSSCTQLPEIGWCSGNSDIASVSNGKVTAKACGEVDIFAVAMDGSDATAKCHVYVYPAVYVETVTVSPSTYMLKRGEKKQLSVTVCPEDASNPNVTWRSDDSTIASVDECGCVTANSAGDTVIRAEADDGSEAEGCCQIRVIESTPNREILPPVPNDAYQADPVNTSTGAHVLKNTLMKLFGGQSLTVTAHYDSTRVADGTLGIGWYHNYEKHLKILDSEILVYDTPSTYARYTPDSACCSYSCTTPGKQGYVLHVNHTAQEYPYELNCNYEQTEYYNADGLLAKVVNRQGFETTVEYEATRIIITDVLTNKSVYLEKNSAGKIVRVYDDAARQALLTYTDGCLTSIRDVNGNTLTYEYDSIGRVLYGIDAKNICYFENTYDDYGRVATQKDADGAHVTAFVYNGRERTITNRNGDTSTRLYNENGLLQSYTNENGETKTYAYDADFNMTEERDGAGNVVKKVYNLFGKPMEITDKNGNKTAVTYDAKGNVIRIRYPEKNGIIPEESFTYNDRNQLLTHTDLRGTVTVYTYDENGMPKTKKVGSRNAITYTYENGFLKSTTDAKGNTIGYAYNTLGQMISETDAQNHTTSYEYDLSGNLTKVTDANGKTVTTAYDCNYQKTSVTDANGNKTEYTYTGNMKNASVLLPNASTVAYEYDAEDRPVKTTDQAGNITLTVYDKGGRVLSKQAPDGATVTYEYDAAGNVVKETNPKGASVTKTYDAMGNVLTAIDADGNITRFQYDAMSRMIRKVNPVSGVTLYTYSAAGDLLTETDALGNTKRYTYDDYGNRLTATDARGNTTAYTYDANNNLLTATDPLGNTTTYTYNSLNQLISVKDAKNRITAYGYDALGRQTTVTDPKNNVYTKQYDANGNVTKVIDAKGNTVSETTYNNLNLPATVKDAAGKTTAYTYNALGKVASETDPLNNSREYTYNSRGMNTQVKDPLDNTSTAAYDALGNITRLAGPLGGNTEYTYDNVGRLISESTPSGGTLNYGYNELNLREELTNARGEKRKYFYDALGRITGFVGAEDSVSYTYDANGNVLTVTDKTGTVKRTYDALNRVISYTDTYGKTITYTYDAVGCLTCMMYPDNTAVHYEYDAIGNLTKVTDWASRVTTYTYDANNRVIGETKPDGSVTTTAYDNAGRITSTEERTALGTIITGYSYVYDDLSRIVEETHLDKNRKMCYTYDNLSRVVKRTVVNLSDHTQTEENFTYDAAGNVTADADDTFSYDTNNRLTSYNGAAVSYDLDGNMLYDGVDAYTFDSANRLITVGDTTYTYNAENTRIRKQTGAFDTTYTYNTNARLSQLLTKTVNGTVTKYVYGLGLIGEEKQDLPFKVYHFDYRGSTAAITDVTGYVTDRFEYDTYGRQTEHIGSSFVIFGYNGRDGVVTDNNGLIYMRARYYNPELRRFINADVLHGKINDSTSLNRYAYVNGNPVSFVDPKGKFGILTWMLLGFGAVVLAGSLSGCSDGQYKIGEEELGPDDDPSGLGVEYIINDGRYNSLEEAIQGYYSTIVKDARSSSKEMGYIVYKQYNGYYIVSMSGVLATNHSVIIDPSRVPGNARRVAEIHTHPWHNDNYIYRTEEYMYVVDANVPSYVVDTHGWMYVLPADAQDHMDYDLVVEGGDSNVSVNYQFVEDFVYPEFIPSDVSATSKYTAYNLNEKSNDSRTK